MRSLKYNPGYDITFTLVSPQPDIVDAQWDIEGGVKGEGRFLLQTFHCV